MSGNGSGLTGAFAALKGFARARAGVEQCELCGQELHTRHPHLLEPERRQIVCACAACALLFEGSHAGRYRRIPDRVQRLADFLLDDGRWDRLQIPIGLAFFFFSTPAQRVVALYPSPAGATECLFGLAAWNELVADNPVLAELEPDVEALLVNRTGTAREHYRVPIDECYHLVGLLRKHWRGLSGGVEVWKQIEHFFAQLARKAEGCHG
jgi:hypothetical protein